MLYNRRVHAYRIATILAGSAAGGVLTMRLIVPAVSWAMSPPAPEVVRTPSAQIGALPKDLDALDRLSRRLAPSQVAAMRKRVERSPGDARTRALLAQATWYDRGDAEIARTHREQIVWFVANAPDSPFLSHGIVDVDRISDARTYALVRDLYDEALAKRPNDANVMANYANLLLVPENDRAIALLTQAIRLDPKNPRRYQRRGQAYALASRRLNGARDRNKASLAFDDYLKARSLGADFNPSYLIENAFDAGRLGEVEGEANAALRDHHDADAVHTAHTTLGRVALRRGDLAAAKAHLLDSAKVTGSPVLGSFGPRMELAQELLAKGERKTVLAYLKACGRFWQDDRQTQWAKSVESGGTPDWD